MVQSADSFSGTRKPTIRANNQMGKSKKKTKKQ